MAGMRRVMYNTCIKTKMEHKSYFVVDGDMIYESDFDPLAFLACANVPTLRKMVPVD
jgi:hypothetical protein